MDDNQSLFEAQSEKAAPTTSGEPISQSPPEPTPEEPKVVPPWQAPSESFPIGASPRGEPVSELPPSEEPPPTYQPPPTEPAAFHLEEESKLGKLKKLLPVLLALIIVAFGILAVFKFILPRFQKPPQITLTYWGLWEPESVMRNVLSDWEKDHPNIKINYSQQSPKEYRERLQSALARGEGPDIFRFHITWVPMLKNELDPVPAEVMDAATFERTFYPVAAASLRSGANYLGIPLMIDTLALFYNQDIFTAAGVSPPQTWDELRQLASQLTLRDENGRIQRAGVALGTTGNVWHWSDILALMMLQNGVDLTNPTGSLAEDALAFYTIFNKTDRVWDETLPGSTLAFATGKVAMYFGFSWDVFEIKNINPDLDFRVVPVPQLPGGDLGWASFWVEGVAKKSKYKSQAWEFMKFLSSRQTMEKLYQSQSQIRLFGEPYSRIEMASLINNNPMVAPFVNQASKAKTWYLSSRTFDNGINDKMIKYFEDAVNGVNLGKSPTEVLSTTAQGVSQILSQYGLGSYIGR
jgi:multiple sugar transport system substrate-binding protein